MKRKFALIMVGAVIAMSTTVSAATSGTSWTNVKKLSGAKLQSLVEQGDVTITNNGKPVAVLTKVASTTTPQVTAGQYPSDLLDLTNWYLTLPTGTQGHPDTVNQPKLTNYENKPYFYLNDSKDGVVFAANAGGVTTSGSQYPRSELREMNGTQKAGWDSKTGVHTMEIKEAITKTPPVKADVVAGQIHDASNDVMEVRLQKNMLAVHYNDGSIKAPLATNYQLGTVFTVKIEASSAGIKVYYNDTLKVTINQTGSGWYFKAGCYTQSNVSKGDSPDAYGQVIINALKVTHQ
jgi:antitoxin (DNA-binding transcriptional repressor) of toxin-antitoxin stability system